MSNYGFSSILETVYSVGNMDKVKHFYCDYGGWNSVGVYATNSEQIQFWGLKDDVVGSECLIQSYGHPTGQLRLVKFENVHQEYLRSSQQPWDIGGIMDINIRVHEVANTFEELRELGWHGLSDPLLQVMGPYELYDILMKGYDDTIMAFTHRVKPELNLTAPIKLATHVYNSSVTVHDLETAKAYYVDDLGCQVLNSYEVIKDSPQENMFGLPFNLADKVKCKACFLSFDGERDTVFQIIEFEGVTGKNFSKTTRPPHRGYMEYRIEVFGIENYYDDLLKKGVAIQNTLQSLVMEPYGEVALFSVISPEGVWLTFLERKKED
ncbi:MAG: hypothetical protein AAF090_17660 [Bacteroidota bacterium]